MEVIFGTNNIKSHVEGSVITVGNFDGVHLGHRHLINKVKNKAQTMGLKSIVMTFDRHPTLTLSPQLSVPRLFSVDDLKNEIEKMCIDVLIVEPFTYEFSKMSAENFVDLILCKRLGAKHIVAGHDFAFGQNRIGNFSYLKDMSILKGFTVEQVEPFLHIGEIVSSTRIRNKILKGEVEEASASLGRFFYIQGTQISGEGRGRTLGFPTINMETKSEIVPANGVYITQVFVKKQLYSALTNIGTKPTFHENFDVVVESYLLDKPLNGIALKADLKVIFHRRLRPELKFASATELISQIEKDVVLGKKYFKIKI